MNRKLAQREVGREGHEHDRDSLQVQLELRQHELQAWRSFVGVLSGTAIESREQQLLPSILQHAERLGVRRTELADLCELSEASLSRWTSRQVTPHRVMARAAIQAIREMAAEKSVAAEREVKLLAKLLTKLSASRG